MKEAISIPVIANGDIKDYKKALEFYNKKIELTPKDPLGYSNRGDLYQNYLKDNEKALTDYNKSVELELDNAIYYNNLY